MTSYAFVPRTIISTTGPKRKLDDGLFVSYKKGKYSEDDSEDEVPVKEIKRSDEEDIRSRTCPYLDTINRNMLDFDFEKLCSVSLSHLNVYACLVCGKYYQGRGTTTHAYIHSVSEGHHVFLNLESHRFFCLPDDYEIFHGSLEDITYLLNPTFTASGISSLDTNTRMVRAYNGLTYYPGIIGLNNIKANDYCNVILQLLSHISPLRDYFLNENNYSNLCIETADQTALLIRRFGELIRKIWNSRIFKTHVSPHEFLQAVVLCSRKRFQITEQGDAVEFLSWFLNAIDMAFRLARNRTKTQNKSTKKLYNIIARTVQGEMRIYSRKIMPASLTNEEKDLLADNPEYMPSVTITNFFYLTCDLPPPPLYLDELKESIIPQVSLATLLSKFNGVSEKEYKTHRDSTIRKFELRRLPSHLILYMRRFVKNIFTLEKNPTIVNFPIKSIDFGDLLAPEFRSKHRYTTYDLIANIVHDGSPMPGSGTHRIHILHRGSGKWFELQDLHVVEILPQMIPLSETLIQVWAVNKTVPNPYFIDPTRTEPMETDDLTKPNEANEEVIDHDLQPDSNC